MTDNSQTYDDIVTRVIDDGAVSAQQLLVIVLCLIFSVVDGFDITAMAIVGSSVASELSLSPERLGWIFSFALAGMMAGAMFLAPYSDIYGRRKLVIFSLTLVSVSIILTAYAATLTQFVVLRFVSGIGVGAMAACMTALVAEYSPEKYRVLSVSAVLAGYPLGAMMTSVIAGYIMPDYGWRGMFTFGGVVTVVLVFIAWKFLPESLKFLFERRPTDTLQRANRILTKLKKEVLLSLPPVADSKLSEERNTAASVKTLLTREYRVVTITLWSAFFLCFSTLYFLMSWIPNLMVDSGYDTAVARNAFFLFNCGGVIGIFLLGWLSTYYRLSNLILTMLVSSAIGMMIFASAPNTLNFLLTLIFLIGMLVLGGFVGLYSIAVKAYPTSVRSTGVGWAIGLGRSGAVAGPAVAGYLIAAGFDMSANFYFFAVPLVFSGVTASRLRL